MRMVHAVKVKVQGKWITRAMFDEKQHARKAKKVHPKDAVRVESTAIYDGVDEWRACRE